MEKGTKRKKERTRKQNRILTERTRQEKKKKLKKTNNQRVYVRSVCSRDGLELEIKERKELRKISKIIERIMDRRLRGRREG